MQKNKVILRSCLSMREEQGIVNQRKPYKDEWMSNLQSYGNMVRSWSFTNSCFT